MASKITAISNFAANNNFARLVYDRFGSPEAYAVAANVSLTTVNNWMTGKHKPQRANMAFARALLGEDVAPSFAYNPNVATHLYGKKQTPEQASRLSRVTALKNAS